LHRSPGVIFEHDKGKTHSSGKILFSSRIIPYRGSWLDFEFDHHENLFVRIDRRRKLPITTLLRAMSLTSSDILETFFNGINVKIKAKSCDLVVEPSLLRGIIAEFDIKSGKNVIVEKGRRITEKHTKLLEKSGTKVVNAPLEYLIDKVLAGDIVDKDTGEVLLPANTLLNQASIDLLVTTKINNIDIIHINDAEMALISQKLCVLTKCSQKSKLACLFIM
jgi:DNA-directed RNA polymerase subunit beta